MLKARLQFCIPIYLIKHIFPWLHEYGEQRLRSQYLLTGLAPLEVNIPREFLYSDTSQDIAMSNSFPRDRLELVNRINKAFRRNRYTFYEQYLYVWNNYSERSLFRLPKIELEKILLELSFGESQSR